MKVSIIVPVYNTEDYLDQCLCSLVNQTLKDIEIIVVNDGSTDHSQEIIDRYSENHPDLIKPFTNDNRGLSDARNFGIQNSLGEYIGFVDSDDFVNPNMFQMLLDKALETEADTVVCLVNKINTRTGKTWIMELPFIEKFGQSVEECPEILLSSKSFACNKLFRRHLFTEYGFQFPAGQHYEDSAVIYSILSCANKVEAVNQPLYNYHVHREGAITSLVNEKIFDIFKSTDSIIEYFKSKKNYSERYRPTIERLCRGHIFYRFRILLKSDNKKIAHKFISKAFRYMDENFDGWRKNYKPSLRSSTIVWAYKSKSAALFILYTPRFLRGFLRRCLYRFKKSINRYILKPIRMKKTLNRKNKFIREKGYEVLSAIQTICNGSGITCFADFGTLLGFIREGRFLTHDTDIDIGVIAGQVPKKQIQELLKAAGFILWRQYILHGDTVEDSYFYKKGGSRIKFDLNYYVIGDDFSKTWLFYSKPGWKYEDKTHRHVVEMTYSKIEGVVCKELKGESIHIPMNAQQLLTEKYGPGWRKKDKNWVYWRSPAAKQLDEIGYFIEMEP